MLSKICRAMMRSFLEGHPVGRRFFARRYDVSVQGVMEVVVLHAMVGGERFGMFGVTVWKWKIVHKLITKLCNESSASYIYILRREPQR